MGATWLENIHFAAHGDDLLMAVDLLRLPPDTDPVVLAAAGHDAALTHSTSWRWTDAGVVLTFAQVFPDRFDLASHTTVTRVDLHDIAHLPSVECHAVRHLYFLLHTDEEIAAAPGLAEFWRFAAAVADHHHPAVAGLLPGERRRGY